ncbi:hypothetical protein DIPPA_02896 [Diplonema papillatum]|nr:hypothetical protein DIPPA_02896 [Diplonema papillatum]
MADPMMFLFGKPELKLAALDRVMEANRRYQTKADWQIEKKAYSERMWSYIITADVYAFMYVFSAPTAQVKRIFGPPDLLVIPPWRMAKDAIAGTILGVNGVRPQSTGFYRQMWCLLPSFFTLSALTHLSECKRWSSYLSLKDKTNFGDIAGRIDDGTLTSAPVFGSLDKDTSDAIRLPNGQIQLSLI